MPRLFSQIIKSAEIDVCTLRGLNSETNGVLFVFMYSEQLVFSSHPVSSGHFAIP